MDILQEDSLQTEFSKQSNNISSSIWCFSTSKTERYSNCIVENLLILPPNQLFFYNDDQNSKIQGIRIIEESIKLNNDLEIQVCFLINNLFTLAHASVRS